MIEVSFLRSSRRAPGRDSTFRSASPWSRPSDTLSNPFGTTPPPLPSGNPAAFSALLPNINALINCSFSQNSGSTPLPNCPAGNQFGPFLFGGYDPANKLPTPRTGYSTSSG